MWDLALSENSDLIFSAHSDLAGKSGTDLIEQRMIIRLKLHRGTWVYDDRRTLGSQLYTLMGVSPQRAAEMAQAYVREALRDVDEVNIDDVIVGIGTDSMTIQVMYHVFESSNAEAAGQQAQQLSISLPLGA